MDTNRPESPLIPTQAQELYISSMNIATGEQELQRLAQTLEFEVAVYANTKNGRWVHPPQRQHNSYEPDCAFAGTSIDIDVINLLVELGYTRSYHTHPDQYARAVAQQMNELGMPHPHAHFTLAQANSLFPSADDIDALIRMKREQPEFSTETVVSSPALCDFQVNVYHIELDDEYDNFINSIIRESSDEIIQGRELNSLFTQYQQRFNEKFGVAMNIHLRQAGEASALYKT